ncbi:uncharacterized protein LOC8288347 [Ricinus communis]|uniref:Uncharacterized protein n=1 Tax=Ricinus communis TaxID=3988 RepID=B9SRD3_RICCO|nr:uncharacterized protein LOC8288347 [Ricinus communis]EEF33864.1 conserved hypothetical protein [Ricinus communis]|eukprot:XP_002528552.1 uncharacterized protein LOC8288347 [Ricinus communis]
MEDHQLFQPLLATTTSSSSSSTLEDHEDNDIKLFLSGSSIILRLVTIISLGVISLWANYEASKGFDITVVNDIKDTSAGKRFTLLYISNDKAIRIIQNTSAIVENILYPNSNHSKKKVSHVTLRLISRTHQTSLVRVITNTNHEYAIHIVSPSSDTKNLDSEITLMVLQGMARIWIWDDGKPMAPSWLLDGLVEYIKKAAGFADMRGSGQVPELGHFCLGHRDPRYVAETLEHYEKNVTKGFIQRLNQGLKYGWHDLTVDDALGMPAKNFCGSFGNSSDGFSS